MIYCFGTFLSQKLGQFVTSVDRYVNCVARLVTQSQVLKKLEGHIKLTL